MKRIVRCISRSAVDVLDVVDKHSDQLKMVIKGFMSIYEGTKGFIQGFTRDVKGVNKKYAAAKKRVAA